MADFESGTAATFGLNKLSKTKSLASSTLTNSVTAGALSISVDDATNVQAWPTADFVIRFDNELVAIDSRSGNNLTVNAAGRGYDGTTAATHSSGVAVRVVEPSISLQYSYDELVSLTETFTGTADNDITIGTTSPMFWDSTNKRLGVGTITPGTTVEVNGDVTADSYIGDGSQLTGIAGATGGVSNAVNTNLIADDDDSGSGIISLEIGTGGSAQKMSVENDGTVHFTAAAASLVFEQATADMTLTWADPAAARTITLADPGGADTLAYLAATQTFTNKTLNDTVSIDFANAGAGADPTLASNAADQTLALTGNLSVSGTISGGGVVDTTGTPVDNQLAVFTDADTIEGDANLTWDGTTLVAGGASNFKAVFGDLNDLGPQFQTIPNAANVEIHGQGTNQNDELVLFDTSDMGINIKSSLGFGIHTETGKVAPTTVARIGAAKATATSGDKAAYIAFSTHNGTSIGERVRIDKDGNVGIGTASPNSSHRLEISTSSGTNTFMAVDGSGAGSSVLRLAEGQARRYDFDYSRTNNRLNITSFDTDGAQTPADVIRIPDGQLTVDGNATFDDSAFDWVCSSCYKSWANVADWPGEKCSCGGSIDWHDDAAFLDDLVHSGFGKMDTETKRRAEAFGIIKHYDDGQMFISMNKAPLFNFSAIAQIHKKFKALEAEVVRLGGDPERIEAMVRQ